MSDKQKSAVDELNKLIDALLEDHIDMYNQNRDSSAALGEDIETFKQAIRTKYISREESLTKVALALGPYIFDFPQDKRDKFLDDLRHELRLEGDTHAK